MRTKDWARMRRSLESVNKSRRELSAAAWASVGVFVSAIFAAVGWWPTYNFLSPEQQSASVGVWIAVAAAGVLGLLLSAGFFWAGRLIKDQQKATIDSIIEDMDDIHDVSALLAAH